MAERPILLIDIETRPDPDLLDNADHWARVFDELEAPKNYKDPLVIEKWKRERLVELREGCALHAHTGRIAALGLCDLRENTKPWTMYAPVVREEDERMLVRNLREMVLLEAGAASADGGYIVAGWNIREFDIPFLTGRCLALGEPMPWRFPRAKDWVRVLDGYEQVGGKLSDWMRVCNLPPKKADGEDTLKLSLPELGEHCRDDLIATRVVMRRLVEAHPLLLGEAR